MFHVYTCSTCGSVKEGAAYHPTDAPRDKYGRIGRDYAGPRYCSEECRTSAEKSSTEGGMMQATDTPTRWTHCVITGAAGHRWNLIEPSGDTLVTVVTLAGTVPRLYWSDGIMQDAENLGDALRIVRRVYTTAPEMPEVTS